MQLVEIMGGHENSLGFHPADGAALIQYTFSQWYYVVIYLLWFAALWFHLTHGVWSMFQSVGLSLIHILKKAVKKSGIHKLFY